MSAKSVQSLKWHTESASMFSSLKFGENIFPFSWINFACINDCTTLLYNKCIYIGILLMFRCTVCFGTQYQMLWEKWLIFTVLFYFSMDTTEENMFVWEGSQVQLRCVVMNTLADNVGKVIWLRNGKILNKFDLTTSSTTLSFQVHFSYIIKHQTLMHIIFS